MVAYPYKNNLSHSVFYLLGMLHPGKVHLTQNFGFWILETQETRVVLSERAGVESVHVHKCIVSASKDFIIINTVKFFSRNSSSSKSVQSLEERDIVP